MAAPRLLREEESMKRADKECAGRRERYMKIAAAEESGGQGVRWPRKGVAGESVSQQYLS